MSRSRIWELGAPATLALITLGWVSACAPRQRGSVAPARPVATARIVEHPRWRAVPVSPDEEDLTWRAHTPAGYVAFDRSGARWLLPHDEGKEPEAVGVIDAFPWVHLASSSAFPVLFFTPDERVLGSRTALGTPEPIAKLPHGADPESFRLFRGGFTVRVGERMLASTDGASFRPVPPLPGHAFVELLLSPEGRGLGLFAPGKLARTLDGGTTWQLVPTDGLSVQWLDEEAGRPLLRPGGIRDVFARSVNLDDGKIARDATPLRIMPRPGRRMWPATGSAEEGETFRLAPGSFRMERGRAADTSGDYVVSLQNGAILEGELGEALELMMDDAQPECDAERLAVCDEQLAIACLDHVSLYGEVGEARMVPVRKDAIVAFDRRGALVSASAAPEPAKGVVLRLHDLVHPETFTEHSFPDLEPEQLALTGGCHRPALWLSDERTAVRVDPAALGRTHALPPPAPWPGDHDARPAAPLGVRADGQLVVGTPAGLVFLPSGATFDLQPAVPERVSFAEDGRHGLWLSASGALLQTADGGTSWASLPSPHGAPEFGSVRCGATRCLFGQGAFLDGFVEEPTHEPHHAAPVAKRAGEPAKLRCTPAPLPYPEHRGSLLSLSPRLGSELFAGLAGDPETTPGSARWAVFGGLDRRLATRSLPPLASAREAERGGFAQVYGTAGVVSVARTHASIFDAANRAHYRRDAKAGLATTPLSLHVAHWLSLDEVAEPAYPGNVLVWGKRAPEALPFRVEEARPGPGVFVREPDGTLLVAEMKGGALTLVARRPDGTQTDQPVVARPGKPRELGVGLAAGPVGRGVYLLETTSEDRPEIRFYPLSEALALGPPTPVPGTLGKPHALLSLPACGADPRGALFRTLTREPLLVETGDEDAQRLSLVQRAVRVTPDGACVERTFATDDDTLEASIVIAGNDGAAVEASETVGLRCAPLDVSGD